MAYSKETRQKARNLYVHQRANLVTIAVTLDVPQGTLSRWKNDAKGRGDDWDIARSANLLGDAGFEKVVSEAVESFTVMFQATMQQVQDEEDISALDKTKLMSSLADSFSKMTKAAGRASPELSRLAIASEVVQKLANFVRREFPHLAEDFLTVLEPFGLEIAKEFSE